MEIDFLGRNPNWKLGQFGPLLVTVWSRPARVDDFDGLEALMVPMVEMHGLIANLSIIDRGELKPPPLVRKRIEVHTRFTESHWKQSAVVVRETGVLAVMLYGLITAAMALSRASTQIFVTRELVAGVRKLYEVDERLRALCTEIELIDAVTRFAEPDASRKVA